MKTIAAALLSIGLIAASPLAHADDIKTERVHFQKGTTGASIKGRIKGYDTMHYMLGAQAGQTMSVTLNAKNKSAYFNIFAPGMTPGNDEAMYISSTSGNSYEGVLPEDGDYLIQVYLYRNAARRNETAQFTLNVDIASSGVGDEAGSSDAKVPGTDFNATGNIPCARNAGQPMGTCEFGVVREGNGNGSITVFWPDGGSRVIFFEMNTPSSYDQSQADGGAEMTVNENAGLYMVTIGDERFELFEAIMAGG